MSTWWTPPVYYPAMNLEVPDNMNGTIPDKGELKSLIEEKMGELLDSDRKEENLQSIREGLKHLAGYGLISPDLDAETVRAIDLSQQWELMSFLLGKCGENGSLEYPLKAEEEEPDEFQETFLDWAHAVIYEPTDW
jgi:hypothetical protein